MSNRSPKRRVNLPLLALTLLCLALPFTAVSCESAVFTVEAEYSGLDLAFGGEPSIEVSGEADEAPSDGPTDLPPQLLVIFALVVLITGLVLLSTSKARAVIGVVVGTTASLFLIAGQVSAQNQLAMKVAGSENISTTTASDLVETRSGFWLALVLLTAMTAYNTATLVRVRRAATAGPPIPPVQQ